MSASTSATCASHASRSAASRLRRSSGSVFDGRRLNHQSPRSTVSPSSRSCSASAYAAATRSITARGSSTSRVDLARLARSARTACAAPRAARRPGDSCSSTSSAAIEPGVGAAVVAEVVVRRVLAAEDRAGLGHHLLDERVADRRADRRAAVLADDLGHRLRADQVVHDRLARVLGRGSPSATIAVVVEPRHRLALVVDEEHAVGVAVEREADVGAELEHRAPGGRVRFSGWIGSAGWFGNVPSSSP